MTAAFGQVVITSRHPPPLWPRWHPSTTPRLAISGRLRHLEHVMAVTKKVIHGRKATIGWEGPWCMEHGSNVPEGLVYWTGAPGQVVTCTNCLTVDRKRRAASGAMKRGKR